MLPSAPDLPSEALSLVVAGGGAAGYMAAITAAEEGVGPVLLLESQPEPLQKVLISGGGRCNVTHACWDPRSLVAHYPRGGRALRGPFSRFATGDAVAWFQSHGLELVEEADGRLFPQTNRAESVAGTLRRAAAAAGVVVQTATALKAVEVLPQGGFQLQRRRSGAILEGLSTQRLLLATGGHPSGRQLAAALGHMIVPPVPSLFTLSLEEKGLPALAGVVMESVGLELLVETDSAEPQGRDPGGVQRFREQGTVLITHWGLSGPATLRLTAFAARAMQQAAYRASLRVDWSGGRSLPMLQEEFARARAEQARRLIMNWRPWPELSRRLWQHLLLEQAVDPQKRWADLTRREQEGLITALRGHPYRVRGRGPFGEEFVTAGGVALGEINLATMESRLVPGLYVAGELMDVDGVTGGFNFQHCWSSGWLAGQAIAAAF
ncbi:MAG: aminoacetone oxidase family FAD-binding enzyme [Cyanobacteriota bacterium]